MYRLKGNLKIEKTSDKKQKKEKEDKDKKDTFLKVIIVFGGKLDSQLTNDPLLVKGVVRARLYQNCGRQ